ncbi:MAG TPA: YfiR family protein [Vicinamibacteria bacterium]
MNLLRVHWRLLCLAPLLGLGVLPPAGAEEMALPIPKQVPLFLKILTYDRNLGNKAGAELAIGIVYDPSDRDSRKATEDLGGVLFQNRGKTVKQLPVKYYTIEYTDNADLERFVKQKGISVLYLAPGNARNLANILELSQEKHLTTLTGVPDYVRKGASVGLGLSQDKTEILINLKSTRLEGIDFDASLLRLATILGPR